MKPHIKLCHGYWVWVAVGCDAEMEGEIWAAASSFVHYLNKKEGRWSWSMYA